MKESMKNYVASTRNFMLERNPETTGNERLSDLLTTSLALFGFSEIVLCDLLTISLSVDCLRLSDLPTILLSVDCLGLSCLTRSVHFITFVSRPKSYYFNSSLISSIFTCLHCHYVPFKNLIS